MSILSLQKTNLDFGSLLNTVNKLLSKKQISFSQAHELEGWQEFSLKYINVNRAQSTSLFYNIQMSKYQGRVQPLQLLRNSYTQEKKIKLKDKTLVFQKDIRLPVSQLTAWLSPISNKQYTLGSIWLYLQSHLKRIPDYLSKVSEYDIEAVIKPDRDEMVRYFLGETSESACINNEAKLQLSMKNNLQRSHPTTGFDQNGDPAKKQKTEHILPLELQVIELIYKFQRPTSSKTRSLRCPHKSFQNLLDLIRQNSTTQAQSTSNEDKKMRINTFMEQKKNPIIVVPQHLHPGNLCIGNIEKFLLKGQYSESQGDIGFKRWTQLEHTIRGKNFKFDVTNNPSVLRPEDWNFVVAIFVEGKKRQFDSWALKDPVQLFRKTKGFLLRFVTKQMSEAQQWNVRILTLDKNLRYRDSEVKNAIWKDIQSYLSQRI